MITGSLVRLTGSGLGCESWPGCQEGAFFPASDYHQFVEFGNRVFGIFPIALTILVAWAARTRPRWLSRLAIAVAVLTVAEAPLGLATIRYELPPEVVIVHFLIALLALGGAVVIALAQESGKERSGTGEAEGARSPAPA